MTKKQIINYLKTHKEKFQKEYEVEEIGLFGSYAHNEAREDISFEELDKELAYWQHHYNWYRPHSSLNGMTPMDKYNILASKTPFWDKIIENYDLQKERIRVQDYALDCLISKLK